MDGMISDSAADLTGDLSRRYAYVPCIACITCKSPSFLLLCDWIQPHSSHWLVLQYQEKNVLSSSFLCGSDFSTRESRLIYVHLPEQQPGSPGHQNLLVQDSCKTGVVWRVSAAEPSLNSQSCGAPSPFAFPVGGRLRSSYTASSSPLVVTAWKAM